MTDEKSDASIRCFAIIATVAAVIAIADITARAFFYAQAQRLAPYLPLLIGSIALVALGMAKKYRDRTATTPNGEGSAGGRRVRVTGPIK